MSNTLDRADWSVVTGEDRGAAIQGRIDRLGISDREFHERTGIDRKTLRRAINNDDAVRASTYGAIEAALTELERLVKGVPAGDSEEHLVEFTVEGNFGVRAIVKGPISDMAALQEAAARLVAEIKRERGD